MPESKSREKFVRLAEARVTKTLKDIKLIGNLSNRGNYSYTDEDARKIYQTLKKAVEDMKSKFDSKGDDQDEIFKL